MTKSGARAERAKLSRASSGDAAATTSHPQLVSRFADYLVEDRRLQLVVEEAKPGWVLKYRVIFPAKCLETPMFVGGFFQQFAARNKLGQ